MFHVKHASAASNLAKGLDKLVAVALLLVGCGYGPVYSGADPAQRLSVVLAPTRVPNAAAVQATLAGARAELARAGSLRAGSGYPRLVIEVLRVDDQGTGIRVVPAPGEPGDEIPLDRGTAIGVLARGWVEDHAGGEPVLDTGDLRRVSRYRGESEAPSDASARHEALRAAGRAVGRALARRALGQPEPSDEAL